MKLTHRRDYAEARRDFYPSTGDQLDAIWKAIRHLYTEHGITMPPGVAAVLDEVEDVKRKCPKEGFK